MIGFLLDKMRANGDGLGVAEPGGSCSHRDLIDAVARWQQWLKDREVPPGAVVTLESDYGVDAVALFLAVIDNRNTVVPLSTDAQAQHDTFVQIAEVEYRLSPAGKCEATGVQATHAMYATLRDRQHPGLVLFSSGSTGKPKAAVHDLALLLEKFQTPRHAYRTIVFLQLDHIGGVNTLLYALSNGGAVIVPRDRTPQSVCEAIETYKATLLPTSPTFLNLLLLSGEHQRRDLSSLALITYGTEPMPASTLERVAQTFPSIKLLQTYGMTELGILRSQSRDSGSLWVRVGGEGYETKVVDGRLWIRARSAMLGYLNAPSPFDADGFMDTGDQVEVDGEWLRILGRVSDIINVGGSKVYPAEVESVLLGLDNVDDVVVHGEPQPITGQMVVATIRLRVPEALDQLKVRLRQYCAGRLASYKVPVKIRLVDGPIHSQRFKRVRSAHPSLEARG
jgi:acyl-coenzyme A synthetase/AMP-(fatty) acid ligase